MLGAVNFIMWVVPGSGGAAEVSLLIPIAVASKTAVSTLSYMIALAIM